MTFPARGRGRRFASQFEAVRDAAAEHGINLDMGPLDRRRDPDGIPEYVYERDVLLVRDADLADLTPHLDADPVPGRGAAGVKLLRINEKPPDAVRRLDGIGALRRGMTAPNHLMSICPVNLCPADEPFPLPADAVPVPPPNPGSAGHGVRVLVIDTGLIDRFADGHPWLAQVGGDPADPATGPITGSVTGQTRVSFGPTGMIKEYAGHGTFIAGVLKCVAPGVTVHVLNSLNMAGAVTEDILGQVLLAALDDQHDIISLSAGGTTLDRRPHLGLDPFADKLRQDDRTLLVAAAGNDGEQAEFWPAAFAAPDLLPDAVVSVGALRQDGKGRACFSNHGDWVKVFAPGERLVNAFLSGDYSYVDPPTLACHYYDPPLYCPCTCVTAPPQHAVVSFQGMARWSGTSFATPLVAGLVAARMSETGQPNARLAARDLLASAPQITDGADRRSLTVLPAPASGPEPNPPATDLGARHGVDTPAPHS